jgi:hemerythrin-like domain-containing protein
MAVQIGAKPDCGFDDPIGMLKDCHRRIERFLHVLVVVVDRAAGRSLTEDEKSAVLSAMSYFQQGGKRHTADEEESLFPRLRTKLHAQFSAAEIERIESLEHDHRLADRLHETVDAHFTVWIKADRLNTEEEKKLQFATRKLKELYEAHIQIEEGIVFPRASQVLDLESISAMGEEIRLRRE